MKKFWIEWETDFCDNFPEAKGCEFIEADTKQEAMKKFKKFHASIIRVEEVTDEK